MTNTEKQTNKKQLNMILLVSPKVGLGTIALCFDYDVVPGIMKING